MEKTGRKALFQDAPSNNGNNGGNEILEDWAKILKSAVEGDASAKIDINSVDGPLKSLGETLNSAIEKISTDSEDITNKKRLIRNAQGRWREIIQQNPMPMLVVNKNFKIVGTNPAYEEMSGYAGNDLRKMNLRDFRIVKKEGDGIKEAISAGVRSTGEVVVDLPSGKRILEQHCIPVKNDADEITNVLLAYQDLTDLRQEMAEINLLTKKAEAFIKQNPQAITVLGPDKVRLDLNKEYERVWRGSYEELMAKKLYDFDITMTGGEDFYASYETKRLAISEMTLNWQNGEKTYVTLYQVPILDDKGDILVNYYIYQDRTAEVEEKGAIELLQKQSEAFIKQNPQAITVLGPDKSRIDLNREYERVWRGSYEELMRKKLYDFDITMTGGEDFYASYETKRLAISEMTLNWQNGEKTYVTLYQVPILDDKGDILVNYYIYQDRTAEVEEKSAIELLQKQSEAFIKQNPQAITVLGPDKARIDLNREYERVWRGSYEELMRKKLYDFDITMTGGEDFYASYETKRLAISDMELNWANGEKTYVRLYQVPILDENDNILVNYYIYQDLTKDISVEKYLDNEVERLKANLEMFARGDLKFTSVVDEGNEYTTAARENFAQINGSIDGVKDAVGAVLSDVGTLAEAAVEGRLDTRVDTSAHNGEFAKVVEGVNDTLDAVVGPLNVATDFLDGVAEGAKLEQITGDYRGDYARIKESANKCLDVLNALVGEVIGLTQAGVAGNLDVRGNLDDFDGAWSTIVGGINDTMDAVVGPLNVAAEYVDRISKGDIPEKVTDDWKGDFNEVKNNLNQCIDAVDLLVADAGMLANAAAMEEFATRADATQHQGDFRKIVDGMNQTFDGVAGKLYLYESSIDAIPFPVSVTDLDMNWIFFNKAVADLTGLRREDMLGKQCSHWNADICNTGRCGVQMLRKGEKTSFFKQPGMDMDMRVDTQYIQNAKGENIGHIEIIQDITAANRVAEFQEQEVARVTANLAEIAKGNLNIDTTVTEADKYTAEVRKNFVQIKGALDETIAAVGLLVNDAGMLAEATVEGKLDTRADASKHQGDFRKVVDGVNDTLDAVVGPLNVAAEYVDRISKGDIPEKVTDDWKGDFNEVKNNLNQCIDAVDLLVADATLLAKAGVEGRMDVRADASKHQGDFRKIVDGVNGTLDASGAPLGETMAALERMAVNDYTKEIETEYCGDFAGVVGNVNKVLNTQNTVLNVVEAISAGDMRYLETYKAIGRRCENDRLIPSFVVLMENLQAVVDDANMLAQAGINGQLDVRADATRHEGAYGDVIGGINNCLDAVVGPLNVAAEYVDRIGKGDLPEKITDEYAGDFNELKNNLNQCIDGLGGLVEADMVLQKVAANDYTATVEGDYVGLYADVATSLNAVIDRLVHIQDTVQNVAAGDLSDLGNYKAAGQRSSNDRMIPSFIDMMENLQSVVDDANMLAQAGINGQLDVRADATRHEGAYGDVIGGINNCLDAVVGPLNVAAEYVDRIGKGDVPEKITDEYAGDFNELKNNLNQCIDGLGGLIEANEVLQNMAVNDHTAKVEGNYLGIFAEVGHATNKVLGELQAVVEFMKQTAKGDLGFKEQLKARGSMSQNDEMTPAAIAMQENLLAVVNDAEMLAEAGVNGQLDVRADATRHEGAYGDVIGGINNCLDAVVGPMNVAAEYVDRIGKGDIPAKITDVYQGDFNELKNNLNQCIDAVNLLVVDTNMLVEAAAVGKLTARADVSQHAGDYAKIVGGINQTLDIINNPFREVNAAIVQLDVTTDETTRGADEIAKAAEQVAVTSQLCADLSTSLINQIEAVDRQIADLSASNEEIASTSQEVHEHAVQTAKIGEKAQQLGAEANTKMNNVEIIAKQSVEEINTLNSRMKEIDNVVKQVNDITNQINLLALNAAIEAARAGEHGRGFAVVAGEVRNLAEEAKQATGQIDQVIAGVQAISAKTAEGIGTAHIEIGSGVASVNETIGALNEIVQGSQDMKVNIDEIAKAIEEQANMANRIVEAMEESGRLTRETQGQVEELASLAEEASASTEEIGSSIHEVKNMANDLKQTMDKFEV